MRYVDPSGLITQEEAIKKTQEEETKKAEERIEKVSRIENSIIGIIDKLIKIENDIRKSRDKEMTPEEAEKELEKYKEKENLIEGIKLLQELLKELGEDVEERKRKLIEAQDKYRNDLTCPF